MTSPPPAELWMRPKKWNEFQHYQDGRTLKWIKNYIELDVAGSKFCRLSWADQGRLQALWRLAARLDKDGLIPYDERYLRAALGDKRFPFGSVLLPTWFHIGSQTEVKRAANREKRSRVLGQNSSLEVRSKSNKELQAGLRPVENLNDRRLRHMCPQCAIEKKTAGQLVEHLENVHGVFAA